MLGGGLVEQRQHHGIDADRLARAGGAGDEQMRHAREIRNHGLAADVLAEREREWRVHLVVGLGAQNLAQGDHLALFVRDLKSHHALARNDLHHAYREHRQRARQVLGESRDLTGLDAGSRTQLEARHHRAWLHGHHLGIDGEVLELHFHQARERLETFGRIQGLAWRRVVQQLQRRQLIRLRPIKQRYLPLALDARALLDDGLRRLDPRRRAGCRFFL